MALNFQIENYMVKTAQENEILWLIKCESSSPVQSPVLI